jgi:hypothetical protein
MNINRNLIPLAVLALAATLSLSGCKNKSEQPAGQTAQSSTPQQPSAAQPSGQPNTQPDSGSGANLAPAGPQAPQTPPPPAVIKLSTGTEIPVRLDQDLGSKISQPGDSFSPVTARVFRSKTAMSSARRSAFCFAQFIPVATWSVVRIRHTGRFPYRDNCNAALEVCR